MSKVLIIEDDRWVAENYHRILSGTGFSCYAVHNAARAVEVLDDFQPDVILLDFLLPEANAVQLLHELQSYDDTHQVPVILCTNLTETRQEASALEKYGVRMVLDKASVTPKQLIAAVTDVIL